jgi:hypothetical protein
MGVGFIDAKQGLNIGVCDWFKVGRRRGFLTPKKRD